MARRFGSPGLMVRLFGLASVVIFATSASAQNSGPSVGSSSASVQAPSSPDFMLGRPRAAIGVRGNWMMARAGSDIFDFVTSNLTLERSAFNRATIGGEFSLNLTPRVDVVVGADIARSKTPSEYRNRVEQLAGRTVPIKQTTKLRDGNISVSAKVSLLPKGQRISRFAWVPRGLTPYVGAGGGLLNYSLEQTGDFVDFKNDHIFSDFFASSAWAPSAHAFGGVDLQIHRHLFMSVEGRYQWASAPLEQKFVGFDPIDLAGFRMGGGLHVVF
jgi:hypothetical protein